MTGRAPAALVSAMLALPALTGCSNDGSIVPTPPGCAESTGITGAQPILGGSDITGMDLVQAMGLDPVTPPLVNGVSAGIAVFSGLGEIEPTQGSTFAWMSTGVAGAGTTSAVVDPAEPTQFGTDNGVIDCAGTNTFDCIVLTLDFTVPADHHTVRFDFEFFSTEFPEFLNAGYNDSFTVSLSSPSFNFTNISTDQEGHPINVNNAFFTDDDCEDFEGTGFDIPNGFGGCEAGATGLLGSIAPVAPGEAVRLVFSIIDAGDGLYDSAVMIDHLETTPQTIDAPETNDCDD
jgi:hypothetical protein